MSQLDNGPSTTPLQTAAAANDPSNTGMRRVQTLCAVPRSDTVGRTHFSSRWRKKPVISLELILFAYVSGHL